MAKIRRPFKSAFDALVDQSLHEKLRLAQDCAPAIRQFQELVRGQEGTLRTVVDELRRHENLIRQASESLNFSAPALEAAKNLTIRSDTAAAMKASLHVHTLALDAAKNLTMAIDSAPMKAAFRVDTSALDWAKTLARQVDVAASIRSSLIGSGVLNQIKALPDSAAQWRCVFDGIDRFTNVLPSDAFVNINNVAESVRLAMPTMPVIDPALFGDVWNDKLAEAVARLRSRAEEVANDPDAGVDNVQALAAEAQAVKASAPPEARAVIEDYLSRVFWWLLQEVAKDSAKFVVYKAVWALIIVLALLLQLDPQLPALPAPPFSALAPLPDVADALTIPGNWQSDGLPAVIRRAGPKAAERTLEFFTTNIRNPNTRQAYAHAVMRFFDWCDDRNLELADITPFAIAAYVGEMQREYAALTVKQHLAAIRMLFDYLVVGQILPMNPASSVRGPKHVVKKGKTPVLLPDEARLLLDSIDISKPVGLRDRALLGVIVYSFARVSAAAAMNVDDYYRKGKRAWLRLREKDAKHHELSVHHKAQKYLDAYIQAAGLADEKDSPLWRSMTRERAFGARRVSRVDVFRMIKRRCRHAGLGAASTCHTLRATGITAYLSNGGTIERAQAIAAHHAPQTTKLYDRSAASTTIEDIERIGI